MKAIRLSVTDAEHARHIASRCNERIARRALRRLLRDVRSGQRRYTLKGGGSIRVRIETLDSFEPWHDGVGVRVGLAIAPRDELARQRLVAAWESARDERAPFGTEYIALLPGAVTRDLRALLDLASPKGVPLWRGPLVAVWHTAKTDVDLRACSGIAA